MSAIRRLEAATTMHPRCMKCQRAWGLVTPSRLPVQIQNLNGSGQALICGGCYDNLPESILRRMQGTTEVVDSRQTALKDACLV